MHVSNVLIAVKIFHFLINNLIYSSINLYLSISCAAQIKVVRQAKLN